MREFGTDGKSNSSSTVAASRGALLAYVHDILERIESDKGLVEKILAMRVREVEHEEIGEMVRKQLQLPAIAKIAVETASLKICAKYIHPDIRKAIRRRIWNTLLDAARTKETTSAGGEARVKKHGPPNGAALWEPDDDALLTRLTQEHTHLTGARKGAPDYKKTVTEFNRQREVQRTLLGLRARGRKLIKEAMQGREEK
jgi:hypothetical protein